MWHHLVWLFTQIMLMSSVGGAINDRVLSGIEWPPSLAWEHNLTHMHIHGGDMATEFLSISTIVQRSYFSASGCVFSPETTLSVGKWGSGAVIYVIWFGLWFLTFGPHNRSSVCFHCRESGETETVVNKAHVFKHTHWNVLMNSHSSVKTETERHTSQKTCRQM